MQLPSTFRQQKPVLISAFLILLFFTWRILDYVYQPEANFGLIVLPVFGWLLFGGLLVWYSLENDADKAWIAKLKKYNSASQSRQNRRFSGLGEWFNTRSENLNESSPTPSDPVPQQSTADDPEFGVSNVKVTAVEEIEFPDEEGSDVAYWGEFFGFFAIYFGMTNFLKHSFYFFFSNESFYLSLWLVGAVLLAYLASQYRKISMPKFQISNFRKYDRSKANYRQSNFYQYFHQQAIDLGFTEIGDYQEVGFRGTALVSKQGDVLLEIGATVMSHCFKIKTLTEPGMLKEVTSLTGVLSERNHMRKHVATDSLERALTVHAKETFAVPTARENTVLRWTTENIERVHNHRRFRLRKETLYV